MHHRFAACPDTVGAWAETSPKNEAVKSYAPASAERASIKAMLARMESEVADLPLFIGARQVRTTRQLPVVMPHRHRHVLAQAHQAEAEHVRAAITACRAATPDWSRASVAERAGIFLKAADLLSGPWRDRLNAATMLGQSKTVHQAEIDSAAELIDFLRFNVYFMERIYREQPLSVDGAWNRTDYRPLEGFVFAITPFNFTAIAGNLPCAPALMGNTVLWKPAATAALSAHYAMELLQAAGLPPGVINLVHGDAPMVAEIALSDPDLAGVHFTGSTAVFDSILREVAPRRYRNYPRIVGETGGKNFILAHASADLDSLATAIIRGAFEYQGQKCSAASRLFIPGSHWPELRSMLCDQIATIKYGDVADFSNFMGAVIDERAWNRLANVIHEAHADSRMKLIVGANADSSTGYFIPPTLYQTDDMSSPLLRDELFGPIATIMVYDESAFDGIIGEIDRMSAYGLTGSVFARERSAISKALGGLRYAAGNFYVNDKPTGAVVGQQPFGGARGSGTNDKAGSLWNLIRWVSPRTIKESFVSPTSYRYPSMG
jgi:1-pyrroline-5-carboxylate dehydrogenase